MTKDDVIAMANELGLCGELVNLSTIRENPDNPRTITKENFEKLKKSIQEFPKMMALRPMVIDDNNIVLGGNMRLKALEALGYESIPLEWVKRSDELTEEEKRRFIAVDNISFGDWDWDELANNWDNDELGEWGLEVWQDVDVLPTEEPEPKDEEYKVIIECENASEQQMIKKELEGRGFAVR